MKKLFKSIFFVALIGLSFVLTGCDNGDIKDVYGVYGLSYYSFSNYDDVTTSYGGDYDYYLVVLYASGSADVIIKKTDAEEFSYSTQYYVEYKEDEPGIVDDVIIKLFDFTDQATEGEASFEYYPKRQDLVYKDIDLKLNPLRSQTEKIEFNKLYRKTADKYIEKAKADQIKTINDR